VVSVCVSVIERERVCVHLCVRERACVRVLTHTLLWQGRCKNVKPVGCPWRVGVKREVVR
jgi:hypothetical protein